MASIPFVGAAYESISPQFSSQTCINLYPVLTREQDMTKYKSALFSTPGKSLFADLSANSIRQIYATTSYLYAIADDKFYQIDYNGSAVLLGTLNTTQGRCSITSNFTQIGIVDGSNTLYVYNTNTNTFTKNAIPNSDTASTIIFQDAYGIFTLDNSTSFQITNASDFTTMDILDRGSVSSSAEINKLVTVATHNLELWLFGTVNTEIWQNVGASPFPYQRLSGAFLEVGCAAKFSVQVMDNTLIWLGRDIRGRCQVYRADGYRPAIISTEALHTIFETYGDVTRAFAYSYTEAGHTFYVLTFPDAPATWVYDVTTQLWHRRTSWDPNIYNINRDLSNCYAFFNGFHIVGDFQSGKLYQCSIEYFDEDGDPIYRERIFPTISNDELYLQFDRLQAVIQTGSAEGTGQGYNPMINLSVQRNGVWGNSLSRSAGKVGERGKRVKWERLGTARNWIFKLSMTDPIRWSLLDVRADFQLGLS